MASRTERLPGLQVPLPLRFASQEREHIAALTDISFQEARQISASVGAQTILPSALATFAHVEETLKGVAETLAAAARVGMVPAGSRAAPVSEPSAAARAAEFRQILDLLQRVASSIPKEQKHPTTPSPISFGSPTVAPLSPAPAPLHSSAAPVSPVSPVSPIAGPTPAPASPAFVSSSSSSPSILAQAGGLSPPLASSPASFAATAQGPKLDIMTAGAFAGASLTKPATDHEDRFLVASDDFVSQIWDAKQQEFVQQPWRAVFMIDGHGQNQATIQASARLQQTAWSILKTQLSQAFENMRISQAARTGLLDPTALRSIDVIRNAVSSLLTDVMNQAFHQYQQIVATEAGNEAGVGVSMSVMLINRTTGISAVAWVGAAPVVFFIDPVADIGSVWLNEPLHVIWEPQEQKRWKESGGGTIPGSPLTTTATKRVSDYLLSFSAGSAGTLQQQQQQQYSDLTRSLGNIGSTRKYPGAFVHTPDIAVFLRDDQPPFMQAGQSLVVLASQGVRFLKYPVESESKEAASAAEPPPITAARRFHNLDWFSSFLAPIIQQYVQFLQQQDRQLLSNAWISDVQQLQQLADHIAKNMPLILNQQGAPVSELAILLVQVVQTKS